MNQSHLVLEAAHKGKITGIAQYDNQTFFTSSMDGEIKLWRIEGNGLVLDSKTEYIQKCYNTGYNSKVGLYFVNVETVNQMVIVSAGTSDSRLLFWVGPEFNFMQILFQEQLVIEFVIFLEIGFNLEDNYCIWRPLCLNISI